MALFAAIGTGLKIGGNAIKSILSKAKAKRAAKKQAKAELKAAAAESALASKLGINLQPAQSIQGVVSSVEEKIPGVQFAEMKSVKKINPVFIVGAIAALLMLLIFKRK